MNYIFVYEDNKALLDTYKNIMDNYILMHEQFKLYKVSMTPQDIENDIKKLNDMDLNFNGIYFLDIHFPNDEHSGIYYAGKIRLLNPSAKIIFISSHVELTYATIEQHIEPFDFIMKDYGIEYIRNQIFNNLDQISSQIKDSSAQKIIIHDEGIKYILPISDVLYIETSKIHPHKLVVHLIDNSNIEFYGKLANVVLENDALIRIHKSFCVNKNYILEFNSINNSLLLKNKTTIPVGKKYKKELEHEL